MFKANIFLLVAGLVFMMGYTAYHGRLCRTQGAAGTLALAHHEGGTNCVMWLMALILTLLETALWQGALPERPTLLWVHLPLALLFLGTFVVTRFILTGRRTPAHKYFAYSTLALFVGACATGGLLLLQLQLPR